MTIDKDELLTHIRNTFPRDVLLERFYETLLAMPNGEDALKGSITYEEVQAAVLNQEFPDLPGFPPETTEMIKEIMGALIWECLPTENKALSQMAQ